MTSVSNPGTPPVFTPAQRLGSAGLYGGVSLTLFLALKVRGKQFPHLRPLCLALPTPRTRDRADCYQFVFIHGAILPPGWAAPFRSRLVPGAQGEPDSLRCPPFSARPCLRSAAPCCSEVPLAAPKGNEHSRSELGHFQEVRRGVHSRLPACSRADIARRFTGLSQWAPCSWPTTRQPSWASAWCRRPCS